MIRDLRTILDGWEYEPGKVSVRKIIGRDGRERIQTRIDLGVLQMEISGRPDGQRPYGCATLLEHHERRLAEHLRIYGDDEEFALTPEHCRELRHEAYLYYQRYLSEFVLEDFAAVEADTGRVLRILALCDKFAAAEADRLASRAQYGYVMMMNTRARAYRLLGEGAAEAALEAVKTGIATIEHAGEQHRDGPQPAFLGEARVLRELHDEVLEKLPEDSAARLQHELALALEVEDYERAAKLRDRLKQVRCA